MGQAKNKAMALAAWDNGLTPVERFIATTARTLHSKFVQAHGVSGACYRTAFFLTLYLHEKHGIKVEPVVGYANDGTSPIMASHAWIEYGGKKTDVSLTVTANAKAQPSGPLLILDHPLTNGNASYSYHREQNAAAIEAERELANDPRFREILQNKQNEHTMMTRISKDRTRMREYLDSAPDGFDFIKLSAVLFE